MTFHALLIASLVLATQAPGQGGKHPDTTSKQPPAGAPWIKDFAEAQRRARVAGRPIFVYSTKTY
ncbi:MAG: hypothetical protein ACI9SE_001717 [Neolewinella sp.]|jgi:hypothetical protein